jgi:hypothetical protein
VPEQQVVLVCRRLLPAGLALLSEAGHKVREGGLEATAEELLETSTPAASGTSW